MRSSRTEKQVPVYKRSQSIVVFINMTLLEPTHRVGYLKLYSNYKV